MNSPGFIFVLTTSDLLTTSDQMLSKICQHIADKFQAFWPIGQVQHELEFGRAVEAVNLRLFLQQTNQVARIDAIFIAELDKAAALIAFNAFDAQFLRLKSQHGYLNQIARTVRQRSEAVDKLHAQLV